jgi:cyclopropane-fatty-acyl-phospholipid synthase
MNYSPIYDALSARSIIQRMKRLAVVFFEINIIIQKGCFLTMSIDIEDRTGHYGIGLYQKISEYLYKHILMKVICHLLCRIEKGRLTLTLPDGTTQSFGKEESPAHPAQIRVNDYRLFARVAFDGEIGLGEAYMEGLWDSDNLTDLLKLFIENRQELKGGNIPLSTISCARNFRLHLSRANTIPGSKENIAEHYDLAYQFYKTFLDDTMTYSCGLFRSTDDTLSAAQLNKLNIIIDKAQINKDDHVLEIGCGWGGFALHAVKEKGCKVTAITISRAQYDYMKKRVMKEGLDDKIEVLCKDYRVVSGLYDKIVSIEMLEAVGHENLGEFFACCDKLLKPDGLVVLQVITMPDKRYDLHRSQPNWIQKHIFPGGLLPSLTAMCNAMTKYSGFQVEHLENIGIHYAETLKQWRLRFTAAFDELSRMGFDKVLRRTWIYYFSMCEAQFSLRVLNDLQIILTREGNRKLLRA